MRTSKCPRRRDKEGFQGQCQVSKGRISGRRRIDTHITNGKACYTAAYAAFERFSAGVSPSFWNRFTELRRAASEELYL